MTNPIAQVTERMIDLQLEAYAWLIRDGEVALRLNAESLGDCADAHRRHSAKPEPKEVSAAVAASVNYRKGEKL